MKKLSNAAVDHFHKHGYYFPVPVLDSEETTYFRRKFEESEARFGAMTGVIQKPHLLFTWLDDLVRRPAILDAVEDIIGPDILIWHSAFFIKEARDPGFVPWHQDLQAYFLDPPDLVSCWIALSESTAENGAMRVLPDTHLNDLPHHQSQGSGSMLKRGKEIAVDVDASKAVSLELRPGEMSIHHSRMAHGSDPNPSGKRRIGFVIRYITPRVKQTTGISDIANLVRGVDNHHHFEYGERPTVDMDPQAVAYHAQKMAKFKEIVTYERSMNEKS